jgi:hypothetical protein
MTDLNFSEESPTPPPSKKQGKKQNSLWNVLTLIILLLTFCCCGYFLLIFINPYSALNPLKPNTPVPPLILPTATWTPISLPATWTPTASVPVTAAPTLLPSWTPEPSFTPLKLYTDTPTPEPTAVPTNTPAPTINPANVPFSTTIKYIESAIFHPESGCNWAGVSGEVFDIKGSPVAGLQVILKGTYNGQSVQKVTVTGMDPLYGKGWFEFPLGDKPLDSKGLLSIQLLDQAGIPLSQNTAFDTFADCKKNMVQVRFKQVK